MCDDAREKPQRTRVDLTPRRFSRSQPTMSISSWGMVAVGGVLALAGAWCNKSESKPAPPSEPSAHAAVSAAPPEPSAQPAAPVITRGPRVYVSNEDSNDISIVDSATNTIAATVFVGKRPRGIRLAPDGKTLYVAMSGSPKAPPNARDAAPPPADRRTDGIAAVDVATLTVARILPSGQDPESFDLTPDGKLMYVSNEETAQASLLDLASWSVVKTIKLDDEPEDVAVKPANDF